MSDTVTKTIENVDKLFASIIVNGEEHVSERYTAPVSVAVSPAPAPKESQKKTLRSTLPVTRSGTDAQATQGEDVYGVELNNILHNFVDRVVTQGLADEVSARQDADSALQNSIDSIEDVIPSLASSSNKLTDSASVENSITDAINDLDVPSEGGNGKYIKSISQVNGKIVAESDWLSATGGGVAFVGTRAQYEVAKLIPLGQTGHIPSGSLVIITDENDYLNSEDM